MKLERLIRIADRVYGEEELVLRAFQREEDVGDGLAEFIARELKDTYDKKASTKDQLEEARRVMGIAYTQLGDVFRALSDTRR